MDEGGSTIGVQVSAGIRRVLPAFVYTTNGVYAIVIVEKKYYVRVLTVCKTLLDDRLWGDPEPNRSRRTTKRARDQPRYIYRTFRKYSGNVTFRSEQMSNVRGFCYGVIKQRTNAYKLVFAYSKNEYIYIYRTSLKIRDTAGIAIVRKYTCVCM